MGFNTEEAQGISMDFALDGLPMAKSNIFVDASNTWGVGGCCGIFYFYIPWSELGKARFEFIARKELLACLIAVFCFGDLIKGQLVRLHTDNDSVYH